MTRLHLGCGDNIREGWVNVDLHARDGVDLAVDLAAPDLRLPFDDGTVTEIEAAHLIEHIAAPLPLLAELWRVARPDATVTFRCPYGSSDTAWEDPTHVRPYFAGSWAAFSQPYYWRVSGNGNGYGYQADWQPVTVELHVADWLRKTGASRDELWMAVHTSRNTVTEMVAVLRAVKPARPASRPLLEQGAVHLI